MRLSKQGQSPLELALILTLVLTGIVVGGPYLLRSINAHFKLWENTTQDSLNDHFVEPPKKEYSLPECHDVVITPGNCGVSGCKKTERAHQITQLPATCFNGNQCVLDDACCTVPLKGYCYGTPNDFLHPSPTPYSDDRGTFKNTNPLIGDRVYTFDCGTKSGLQVLFYDPKCIPKCLFATGIQPLNTSQCPNFGQNLIANIYVTTVDQSTNCNPANQCQIYCNSGFYLNPTSHTCDLRCGNKICEPAFGEDKDSCPQDCDKPSCQTDTHNNPLHAGQPLVYESNSCGDDLPYPTCDSFPSSTANKYCQDLGYLYASTFASANPNFSGTTYAFIPGHGFEPTWFGNCTEGWGYSDCYKRFISITCVKGDCPPPPLYCGDRICNNGETSATCPGDCLAPTPKLCPEGQCADESGGCRPCPFEGTTPFLFSYVKGNYLIENDVMNTYKNQYYELAKKQYEHSSSNHSQFKPTEYYRMRFNPDATPEGIKLQLKEIEPEESNIDQVKLLRVIHLKETDALLDQETNIIKVSTLKKQIIASKCTLGDGKDCLKAIEKIDDLNIEGNAGENITVEFDLTNIATRNLYLTINSWGKEALPAQLKPYIAHADSLLSDVYLIDPSGKEKPIHLKDIHPKEIETPVGIDLGRFLKGYHANKLIFQTRWNAHHFVDYIGLIETIPSTMSTEKLPLIKAMHSNGKSMLKELTNKDKIYAHTVRGEQIELTFKNPQRTLKADEKDTYFFISSGFYHGLRTFLYPNVDPTESYRKELKAYVDQLKDH